MVTLKRHKDDGEMVEIWSEGNQGPVALFAVVHHDLFGPDVLEQLDNFSEVEMTFELLNPGMIG